MQESQKSDTINPSAIKITQAELDSQLKPAEDLELVAATMTKVLIDPNSFGGIAIIDCDGHEYPFPLTSADATRLVFVQAGAAASAHIQTVHQVLMRVMEDRGLRLASVVIEAKSGDIIYSRLRWTDEKGRALFNTMSPSDALILCSLSEDCTLHIVKRVLQELDPFEDWNSEDEYIDG